MIIKTANLAEIKTMVAWAAAEGWNPGLNDAECYALADKNGFLVGYLNDEMVAAISAVKYQNFAFVGFYMVKPAFRGKGLGWQIWQHAMSGLKSCNVALDGVVEQQHNYQKSGFKLAHNNIRYQWQNQTRQSTQFSKSIEPSKQNQADKYLEAFFPATRTVFNQAWRQQSNAKALTLIENSLIKAFGVIRRCEEGYKVGPLFADNKTLAAQLLDDLCTQAEIGANIYLDVPEPNQQATDLVASKMAVKVFETARMYTGSVPDIQLKKTYGITSFEIG
jgi:GNAT superfamily N-acetyltransferase